jgi:uncharacterized protein YndB with AHSA1/START domain
MQRAAPERPAAQQQEVEAMTAIAPDGTLVTIDGRPALRFERQYRQPVDRVWRAVTEADEMVEWFPSAVEGERSVGAELTFPDAVQRAAAQAEGRPYKADGPVFRGQVVAYEPPAVFSFTWGGELLRFELAAEGDGTRLVFTQVLSHPSVAARNGAGWHQSLGALGGLLGEPPSAPEAEPDWTDVYADYIRRMGPPLGTPSGAGAVTWERATHVEPDRVREVTTDPAEIAAWGGGPHAGEPLRWDIEPAAGEPDGPDGTGDTGDTGGTDGTIFRLTHAGIGSDAALASAWHALLLQLDLYLAAGQVVPADPTEWVGDYEKVLAPG